jgi:hypothetical protein
MIYVYFAWFLLTIIFAALAHFAIWARTGNNRPRTLSVVAFFLGSALSFAALFVGAGVSPPCVPGITAPTKKFTVLGFFPEPLKKIDIMFNDMAYGGTRVCHIPWSDKTANALVEAQQQQMQLGMEIPGVANGHGMYSEGAPSTFPLQNQQDEEKPHTDITVP